MLDQVHQASVYWTWPAANSRESKLLLAGRLSIQAVLMPKKKGGCKDMLEMWESSKILVEATVRAEPKMEVYFRMAWQERMAGGAGPAATQSTEGEQGPLPGRRSLRNHSKNEMRTVKMQAPWLGSQVIKHGGSLSNKWLLLISFLFIIFFVKNKWRLWEEKWIFLKVLWNRWMQKGGWSTGEGSGSQQLLSWRSQLQAYMPGCGRQGSLPRGKWLVLHQRGGVKDWTPQLGCRKL